MMFNRSAGKTTPVRTAFAGLLAGTIISATALTGAVAQPAPPQPNAAAQAGPGEAGPRGGERAERGMRHHHGRHHRGPRAGGMGKMMKMSPAEVAGALSAIETGIGITPDQMDVWRGFSSAAVAFAAASGPKFGPRGDRGMEDDMQAGPDEDAAADQGEDLAGNEPGDASETRPGQDEAASPSRRSPFGFIDRITQRAIERGEAARQLQSAADDLEQALTPEQIDTARVLVRSMVRDAWKERRGPHGKGGPRWHGGPGRGGDQAMGPRAHR